MKNRSIPLGLSSYAYTWSLGIPGYDYQPVMDVFGLIDKTREYSLPILQIADNLPLHQYSQNTMEEIKQISDEAGISIEVGAKGITESNLERYIEIAHFFESPILRFIIDDATENYIPDIDLVINTINNYVGQLEVYNILLVIENHDRFRSEQFLEIINKVNNNNVGICLDCANSIGAGEGILETIKVLSPVTYNLHLKDISIQRKKHKMGFDIVGVPFGEGIIPLNWVIDQMPKKCTSCILELWMPPAESWTDTFEQEDEWVKQSIEYINSF